MVRIFYFLRNFKVDILATAVAIAGILSAWWFAPTDMLKNLFSLSAAIAALLVIIYTRSKERDFLFSGLTRRKDREDWIGEGVFEFSRTEGAYEIRNAEPGFIHAKALAWGDYRIAFDFKIGNTCIGVILRAVNLANCLMLQITQQGIRPHIKINGGWQAWNPEQVGLVFDQELNIGQWHRCTITCDKDAINIIIERKKTSGC
jgi:hypothetical protein